MSYFVFFSSTKAFRVFYAGLPLLAYGAWGTSKQEDKYKRSDSFQWKKLQDHLFQHLPPYKESFFDHGHVWSLALDEHLLAMGTSRSHIVIWEMDKEQSTTQKRLDGHQAEIVDLQFYQENLLMSASNDCSMKIWDLTSFSQRQTLQLGFHSCIIAMETDSFRDRLFGVSQDGKLREWSLETQISLVREYQGSGKAYSVSRCENLIIVGEEKGTVEGWDTRSKDMVIHLSAGYYYPLRTLYLDSTRIMAGTDHLAMWDLKNYQTEKSSLCIFEDDIPGRISFLSFRVQGNLAFAGIAIRSYTDGDPRFCLCRYALCMLPLTLPLHRTKNNILASSLWPFQAITNNYSRLISAERHGIIKVFEPQSKEVKRIQS